MQTCILKITNYNEFYFITVFDEFFKNASAEARRKTLDTVLNEVIAVTVYGQRHYVSLKNLHNHVNNSGRHGMLKLTQ